MKGEYTAIVKKDGRWWIGQVAELPGAISQARTRKQFLENLREVLVLNKEQSLACAKKEWMSFEEVPLVP